VEVAVEVGVGVYEGFNVADGISVIVGVQVGGRVLGAKVGGRMEGCVGAGAEQPTVMMTKKIKPNRLKSMNIFQGKTQLFVSIAQVGIPPGTRD
jgi:hypothetical protein